MNNKKAVTLSLETIVVTLIIIIVLFVVVFFIVKYGGQLKGNLVQQANSSAQLIQTNLTP
jgi:hypothetical protein